MGALGGERHLAHVPAAELDEPLDLGERRVAQQGRVVRAAPRLREPRALEVDAVDEAVVGELGEHRDPAVEVAGAIVTRLASRLVEPRAWWWSAAAAAASWRRSVKAEPPPPWQWMSTYAGRIVPLTRSAASAAAGRQCPRHERRHGGEALAVDRDRTSGSTCSSRGRVRAAGASSGSILPHTVGSLPADGVA